ncbi:MAG: hypothetical protein JNK04_24810 [Myxococcales bacterium]|nr:hypothetical protein [Myxococcales bacterium]
MSTILIHALVLLADRTAGLSLVDLLVPFRGPIRPFALGLGVLAAYGILTLHLSHALRKLIGPRSWRRLHYVSFAAFLLASLHGILMGSDTSKVGFKALYIGAALLVSGLVFLRLCQAVIAERRAAGRFDHRSSGVQ